MGLGQGPFYLPCQCYNIRYPIVMLQLEIPLSSSPPILLFGTKYVKQNSSQFIPLKALFCYKWIRYFNTHYSTLAFQNCTTYLKTTPQTSVLLFSYAIGKIYQTTCKNFAIIYPQTSLHLQTHVYFGNCIHFCDKIEKQQLPPL